MTAIFVTSTDTGAGKTLITGLLARFLLSKGHSAVTQKWIQTGRVRDYPPHMACYNFKFASSPHLAAKLENRTISIDKITKSFKALTDRFDFVIVEGTGGVLVPFNDKRLIIDIVKKLSLPVIVVIGNKLGAINHALLTIEALRRRKIEIIGLIFNNRFKNVNSLILKDNVDIVKKLTGENVLGVLPYSKDRAKLYRAFLPIGRGVAV